MRLTSEKRTLRFIRSLGEKLSSGDELAAQRAEVTPNSDKIDDIFLPAGALYAWLPRGAGRVVSREQRRDSDA